jgi:HSP20 family protein
MNPGRHTVWNTHRMLPDELRQAFDRFLQPDTDASDVVTSQWAPRVDIREDVQRFVILADIPGVDPAQIEVSMDKGILTIKGEREVAETQEGKFTRVERERGAFHRRFSLPDSADAEHIVANGRHGVLEIVIPKKAQATPRRITINSGH